MVVKYKAKVCKLPHILNDMAIHKNSVEFSVKDLSLKACILVFLNEMFRPKRLQVVWMMLSSFSASRQVLANNRSSAYRINEAFVWISGNV